MAKKKSRAKRVRIFAPLIRGLTYLWRFISKILGSSVRFISRSSRELDPAHQRDGIAFFVLIIALIFSAGIWFNLDNFLGRATYSFLFGAVGQLAFTVPIIFIYFSIKIFRTPDESGDIGRITIGTLLSIFGVTALLHIINGSVGTGATAIREGGVS